jgi:hypothetical protein
VAEPSDSADREPAIEGEVVDAERPLPVLAHAQSVELDRPAPASLPAAAVAATGGFLLGVAVFMIVRVLRRPKPMRLTRAQARRRRKRELTAVDVAATRSFLVDIHVLRDR